MHHLSIQRKYIKDLDRLVKFKMFVEELSEEYNEILAENKIDNRIAGRIVEFKMSLDDDYELENEIIELNNLIKILYIIDRSGFSKLIILLIFSFIPFSRTLLDI